eukprot:scaffold6856_cov124-Isochrysis_galbana.AAC.10
MKKKTCCRRHCCSSPTVDRRHGWPRNCWGRAAAGGPPSQTCKARLRRAGKCLAPYAGERGGNPTTARMAAVLAIEDGGPGSELDKPHAGPGVRPRGGKAEWLGPLTLPKRVPPDPNRYDGGMSSDHFLLTTRARSYHTIRAFTIIIY